MLNYKSKSHRGYSPTYKTDALCLAYFYGKLPEKCDSPDKKLNAILSIICENVIAGTGISADEHKTYIILCKTGIFTTLNAISMILFAKKTRGNTQAVEPLTIFKKIKSNKKCFTDKIQGFINDFIVNLTTKIIYLL